MFVENIIPAYTNHFAGDPSPVQSFFVKSYTDNSMGELMAHMRSIAEDELAKDSIKRQKFAPVDQLTFHDLINLVGVVEFAMQGIVIVEGKLNVRVIDADRPFLALDPKVLEC